MSKVVTSKGFNLQSYQHINNGQPSQVETITIPSNTLPSWGNYFQIDIKEVGVSVGKATIGFNLGALSGSGSTSFNPASTWITHVDILQNGKITDSIYGDQTFLMNQLFNCDEDRLLINNAQGNYANVAQRIAMAATASTYYVDLVTFFNQSNLTLLETKDNISIRVYLDNLINVVNGGVVPSATFLQANLFLTVTRFSDNETQMKKLEIYKRPTHHKFNEVVYQSATIPSGSTSANITLTSFNGNISFFMVVCRPSANLNNLTKTSYDAVSTFELTGQNSKNICGGSPLSMATMIHILGNRNSVSSYLSETSLGVTNNKANVLLYSFSSDLQATVDYAQSFGHYHFGANEILKLVFPSALSGNEQVDIWGFQESVLEVSATNVTKKAFHN